jgi:diguanylate cyclase (GGDEF)-like protein/PAS domain S-box-containing protein
MAIHEKVDANVSGAPRDCPMPSGECFAILDEYATAIQLIQRLRDASGHGGRSSVRHWSLPLDRISADFFCGAEHPRFGWYGLIADASGHGLVSSVFALHVPMIFREAVMLGMSLPAIYERIGRFLTQKRIGGYYVAGMLVRVAGREVEVINGGMPDAFLIGADGRLCETFSSLQLPFGVEGDEMYAELVPQRYRLARNESASFFSCSDGLSEIGALAGAAFGRDWLLNQAKEGPERMFDSIVDLVGKHGGKVHDDISLTLIPVPLPEADGVAEEAEADRAAEQPTTQVSNISAVLRIIEHLDTGLILTDSAQRILYVNPAFTTITGYEYGEAVGQTPRLISSGRHDAAFYRAIWEKLEVDGNWCGEIWNRRKDGSLYLQWLDIRTIYREAGRVSNYLATFTDVMRMREKDERLHFIALHDPVTGLANRILLNDRGQRAITRADRLERALAVLFIDLDRFKTINDSLGHDIGDEVLVQVARRLGGVLREDDTLARFGGDQFVCLLPDMASREDALLVANKLLAELVRPVEVAGHRFKIGASIGISAYPLDGLSIDDLIVRADRAMMRVKRAGGNLVRFFSASMAAEILVLFYQPKVDLVAKVIVGAEALVRWRHPQRGLVPPGEFIPVAERSDLIAKIGQWVLGEACGLLARREGSLPVEFQIAVNVSPKQFERGDLAEEIGSNLEASGVAPRRLQIEVTESAVIQNPEGVAETLQRIVDMGVSVALDDFGTGYSNLTSLSRLPIDTFKLDQSFVRGIDANPANTSIAKAVWHLGDGLGKKIVAEGVETCIECDTIMGLGYSLVQGYRFGRPMAEEEFFIHFDRWRLEACSCPA